MNMQNEGRDSGSLNEPYNEYLFNQTGKVFLIIQQLKNAFTQIKNITKYRKQDSKQNIRTLKLDYTISQHSFQRRKHYPKLLLAGKWLSQSDFVPGKYVKVIAIGGLIIIVPVDHLEDEQEQ